MNKPTWIKCIAMLKAVYGVIDDGTEKLYLSILKDIPDQDFEYGVKNLVTNYEYDKFPKPATILKYCGRDNETLAQVAINKLKKGIVKIGQYQSVDLGDRTLHAVIERFGGWEEMCNMSPRDFGFKEKAMIQAYIAAKSSGILGPEYLPGYSEKHNALMGYKEHIKPPKQLITQSGRIGFIVSKKTYMLENKTEPREKNDGPKQITKNDLGI